MAVGLEHRGHPEARARRASRRSCSLAASISVAVAGSPAAHHVDVVGDRAHHEAVHLERRVRPDQLDVVHA